MIKKYFGTDGIRGKVGEAPITAEFMLKLGWAAGRVLGQGGKVLIGKDTRISGYMFESALEAGLSAAGVNIGLLGPLPTPAIAYLTRTLHAQAGIVISASHNPYYDNGVKFFSAQGAKLPDDIEHAIERELERPLSCVDSAQLGKAERVSDAAGRYIEFCKSSIPPGMDFGRMKLVVDCAHGAAYRVAPKVLRELGAEVIKLGAEPDGLNINANCGSIHPQNLQSAVLKHGADLGIALDGDGDRVIMVDHKGELVDGDELLFIIALSRLQEKTLGGGVVGTLMSNFGLETALKQRGVEFDRAAVGDRYVLERLHQKGWLLGGESSGHIICLDRTTTGDGIISALQVLAALRQTGVTLYESKQGITKYPQCLINVKLTRGFDIEKSKAVQDAVQHAQVQLNGQGRILLRPSGTEPLVRVMVEGGDQRQVETLAGHLASVISQAISEVYS
ncbi:MAG: phosphoglucosamine mutase [Gammaproteobacteria bacterium]|nr:MAG: phosphoglucosamine mutase [Gammaproteobacteria bacterium]